MSLRFRFRHLFYAACVGLAVGGTAAATIPSDSATVTQTDDPPSDVAVRIDSEHLPNVVQVHPQVLSGGQPDGAKGFAELRDLGVKTVVSVDGAKPDVALAKKYGLRYVHLPHGYDGIPNERVVDLAKAFRDLPGPVYVHCHHGKHRSPAAATVGCVAAGLISPQSARGVLELAGTSDKYRGLYESAEEVRPLDAKVLDARKADFPEIAKLPPMAEAMVEAMVEIEHSHDRLKAVAEAGWKAPPKHPDVDPAHESLLLRELFTELLRTDDVRARPEGFRKLLKAGEQSGVALEAALRTDDPVAAKIALERITTNCAACHQSFRDVPLDEKP
ncbi:MAG: hypothetical protein WBC44_10805 [Planctomycetaceae bacterium]